MFDLAGITCGHFLVPFWTFFGATLIGKAVVKMHIQKIFIIMAFNEKLVATVVSNINRIPWLGPKIEAPFKEFLAKQKEKLHRKAGSPVESVSFEVVFTKKNTVTLNTCKKDCYSFSAQCSIYKELFCQSDFT